LKHSTRYKTSKRGKKWLQRSRWLRVKKWSRHLRTQKKKHKPDAYKSKKGKPEKKNGRKGCSFLNWKKQRRVQKKIPAKNYLAQ